MESSVPVFKPLIKLRTSHGPVTLSKHLVVDIFGMAYSQEKVFVLFKLLNKNFQEFSQTHSSLIEQLTIQGIVDGLKMRFQIRDQANIDKILHRRENPLQNLLYLFPNAKATIIINNATFPKFSKFSGRYKEDKKH